ncbi:MAG: cysteine desulfurase [Deltaproteobacteria bacterium]|nr:cysteine desulfurase [Deltaproteobacteria bacterium]
MIAYLDNAASTAPLPEVIEAMARTMRDHFANPSSLHSLGAAAARALTTAREQVAALLHAEPGDVIFTGSGTEANALGLLGAARASRLRHVVVSAIEHAAVFSSARRLADDGWQVDEVAPGRDGCLTAEAVLAAVKPETAVVAVMLVNNEIGTLQPAADIALALRALGRRIHFHVDAVQAAGLVRLDARTMGAHSIAISAHKLHGPKGIGALWLGKGRRLAPLYGGGGQERDLRSGTENLPACVGFGVAATAALADTAAAQRVRALRDRLESLVFAGTRLATPTVHPTTPRAPHIASLLLPGLPAEPVLHALESRGIFASEGAACSTHSREPSRVMRALAVPASTGALRFSLSRLTSAAEIERAARGLVDALAEIDRAVRPGR